MGAGSLALDSQSIAIAPTHDARVAPFLVRYPIASRLLEAFRDERGAPARPSVLIVRSGARMPRRIDVIAAFRNAVAMCFVLRARAAVLAGKEHQAAGSWSDLLDFHIVEVDRSGNLQADSPALTSFIGKPAELHLAPSPVMSRELDIRFCDLTLSRLLAHAWRRLYVQGRGVTHLTPIFRSLEIAYQAAAVPVKNVGSLQDFGITIAHWISALETLLWPLHSRAGRSHSVAFLGGLHWLNDQLTHQRYRVRVGNAIKSVTAAQKVIDLMYTARNAFLHGEKFTRKHLVPFPDRQGATLPMIAPVVFRAALASRLSHLFPDRRDPLDPGVVTAWFMDNVFENALLAFFGRDK